MKRDLFVIALCFVAGLGGANVQPILTGAGKLLFPEASPAASISAASGALTVSAGGTNQNVILSPSGTGVTSSASPLHLDTGATPANAQLLFQANTLGALSFLSFSADNQRIMFDADWTGSAFKARDTSVAELLKNGAKVTVLGSTGNIVGAAPVFSTRTAVDLSNGNFGSGGNGSPAYAVDATGDVNASGVYRKGGTAGVGNGSTITVCTGSTCTGATTCTLIFNGGIRTGGTCL